MTDAAAVAPYTLRSIEEMLGLGRSAVMSLVDAGFVQPMRGRRNEYRFSFQDVVLLRTAYQLRQARISPRKMLRSLRQLRARLPHDLPLSGLRIRAVGNDVAVRDGDAQWEAQSGQLLLDLEVTAAAGGAVAFLQHAAQPQPATAAECYHRALSLEDSDSAGAEAAYRQALQLAPQFADAYVNLGALLCEHQRCAEAVALYDLGLQHVPGVALVHFNRGIALEDLGQRDAALASYLRCLALDAAFGDAHYNAARLLEIKGEPQSALRHYSAYRRIQRGR